MDMNITRCKKCRVLLGMVLENPNFLNSTPVSINELLKMKTLVLALVCLFYNAQAQPVPTESRIAMAMGSRAAVQNYKSRWLAIHNGESAVRAYALGNIRSKIVAAIDMLEIDCDMNKGGRGCFATSVPNWSESRGFGNVRNQELMMKAVY